MDLLDRVRRVNRQVLAAATYPLFVLLAFLGAASAMIFYVLPQYETIFQSFGRELPWPTRVLLDIGAACRSGGTWAGMAFGALALLWLGARLTRGGHAALDGLKLRLPVFGPVLRLAALARFSRTLAVQVGNQVPVVRALHLAGAAAGNRRVQALVQNIADDIEGGASVTDAFRAHDLFSGIVLQMIAAGEEAGRLDELLLSAAAYFDSLLMQRIDTLTGLINPLLTAALGAAVAAMMVASFLPVFDMPGALQ